jgi:alkanesulfonate monooxygenase SsuD/methylene tetrahydromethanopterin reductase-like flavin-dependent oxidoreductase (luciferase family)
VTSKSRDALVNSSSSCWTSAEGRVDLGVGVGWLEEEFAALSVSWAYRGRRTDEYIEMLRALWSDDPSSCEEEFDTLSACAMFPKPIQRPHPPLHIGESAAALARVARVGQGWHTFNRTPEELAAPLAVLDTLLAKQGRRRSKIHITVCAYFKPLNVDLVE